jgi:hypothetical protein
VRRSAAVLAVVVVLAACGGGSSGPPLSAAQLVTKVDAECLRLQTASNDLQNAQDPNAEGATVARYLHEGAAQLRSHVEAIGDLVPPSSLSSDFSRFVSLLEHYADGLDSLASRTRAHETYTALLNRSTSQVNSLNSVSDQANSLAAKLNFKDCAT